MGDFWPVTYDTGPNVSCKWFLITCLFSVQSSRWVKYCKTHLSYPAINLENSVALKKVFYITAVQRGEFRVGRPALNIDICGKEPLYPHLASRSHDDDEWSLAYLKSFLTKARRQRAPSSVNSFIGTLGYAKRSYLSWKPWQTGWMVAGGVVHVRVKIGR